MKTKRRTTYRNKRGGEDNRNEELDEELQLERELERIGFEKNTPRFDALVEHFRNSEGRQIPLSQIIYQLQAFQPSQKELFERSMRIRGAYDSDRDMDGGAGGFSNGQQLEIKNQLERIGFEENTPRINRIIRQLNQEYTIDPNQEDFFTELIEHISSFQSSDKDEVERWAGIEQQEHEGGRKLKRSKSRKRKRSKKSRKRLLK
jgi:hypothetical protein